MSKVGSIDATSIPECSPFEGSSRTTPIEMKVFSSDIAFKDWTGVEKAPTVKSRAKSYSSFSRLTSFMAGSPRTAVKYYCSNPRKGKVLQRTSKSKIEPVTKTDLLLKQRKNAERDSSRTCTEATVEAARLALAARAEYKKRKNSKSLEKAAFYIVMNEKTKNDLVGRKAGPSRLEDIGSLLLEEAQRCELLGQGEQDCRSLADRRRLQTPLGPRSTRSNDGSNSRPSKSQKKDSSRHSRHHHRKERRSLDSKSSEGVVSATPATPATPASTPSSSIAPDASYRHATTTDDNQELFEASSTAMTTASTPDDFLSNDNIINIINNNINNNNTIDADNNSLSLLMPRDRSMDVSKAEMASRSSVTSNSISHYERQKEALLSLNGASSSVKDRLSSTVSSVFDRRGSSALLNPFPDDNPITTTSANSKPASPASLVVAGIVMLAGTCAFLVSFALGRQGSWTLAASVVMGVGAVLVFSGLCWYLAHTSAPAVDPKSRSFGAADGRTTIPSDVEIKVVDRQQLNKLIKQGARVETVNSVSIA